MGNNVQRDTQGVLLPEQDYRHFKIVLLGEPQAGKSMLLKRFCENTFTDKHTQTLGIDYRKSSLDFGSFTVSLQLWDLGMVDRYRKVLTPYLRANAWLFVYDVCDPRSLTDLAYWFEILDGCDYPDAYRFLVGNKIDKIDRQITPEQVRNFCSRHSVCDTFEVSCKTGENVVSAVLKTVLYIAANTEDPPIKGYPVEEGIVVCYGEILGWNRAL